MAEPALKTKTDPLTWREVWYLFGNFGHIFLIMLIIFVVPIVLISYYFSDITDFETFLYTYLVGLLQPHGLLFVKEGSSFLDYALLVLMLVVLGYFFTKFQLHRPFVGIMQTFVVMSRSSRVTKVAAGTGTAILIGVYFYVLLRFPLLVAFGHCLLHAPLGWTYDHYRNYKKLLNEVGEKRMISYHHYRRLLDAPLYALEERRKGQTGTKEHERND